MCDFSRMLQKMAVLLRDGKRSVLICPSLPLWSFSQIFREFPRCVLVCPFPSLESRPKKRTYKEIPEIWVSTVDLGTQSSILLSGGGDGGGRWFCCTPCRKTLFWIVPESPGPGETLSQEVLLLVKGDILKGDICKWDFTVKFHLRSQFVVFFLRQFHR